MRLEATYNYEIGNIKIEIEWGELKVNVRATVERVLDYDYEENKTRCRVYNYPPHDWGDLSGLNDRWIGDQPNWEVLQILADGYANTFIRDESLWRLKWSGFNENIEIDKVRAAADVELPPGIGRWLF